jgi:hypothetical protein
MIHCDYIVGACITFIEVMACLRELFGVLVMKALSIVGSPEAAKECIDWE